MSQHPVDALKEYGMPMDADTEAELRRLCDEQVPIEQVALMAKDHAVIKGFIKRLGECEPVQWGGGRVITRVMDDGVKTKDGCA